MKLLEKIFGSKKKATTKVNLSGIEYVKSLKEDVETVNASNISENIKTKKKNYYKIIFDNTKKSSDIALYIAPIFRGTKLIPLKETIKAWVGNVKFRDDYPLYYTTTKTGAFMLHTNMELILNNCRDIHMELDDKEGMMTAKYIFHCADNEDGYDIYFVCYSGDLPKEAIDLLLKPRWVK